MSNVLKELAVTIEVTGTEMSKAAVQAFEKHLEPHPEQSVVAALRRCQREVKGRLTLADILERIDDGRPGAEAAWAMLPKSEEDSAVLTTDIFEAMGPALSLLNSGDKIGARMAFLESYRAIVQRNRASGVPVVWRPSLGYDQAGRIPVLAAAVADGKLTSERALMFAGGAAEPLRLQLERNKNLPAEQKR